MRTTIGEEEEYNDEIAVKYSLSVSFLVCIAKRGSSWGEKLT